MNMSRKARNTLSATLRLLSKGTIWGVAFAVIATGLVQAAQTELSAATYEGIQAALDALPPEGGRVFIPAGTYIMKGSLKPRDGATISGAGPATVLKACDQVVQKSAKPLAVGDRQIVMQSVQGFATGMDVFVHEKLDWSAATQKAFSYTITSIEGNTLKFDKAAVFAQPADATVCSGAPVILVFMKKNIVIENLTVDGNKQKASTSVNLKMAGIYLWGALDCTVQNCRLDNCWGDGISAQFPPTGFKADSGQPLWDPLDKHEGNGTLIVNNHIRAARSFGGCERCSRQPIGSGSCGRRPRAVSATPHSPRAHRPDHRGDRVCVRVPRRRR